MKRAYPYTNEAKPGKDVKLPGWVAQKRDLGGLKFFMLRDREGTIQVTLKKGDVKPVLLERFDRLNREDYVLVSGKVRKAERAPGGRELIPDSLEIVNVSHTPLPVDIGDKIESGLDTRLDWRAIDLRNQKNLAIFKIQAKLVQGMQEFLRDNGFLQVFTPCLMGAPSESGSEVFAVPYFNKEVFLRQDPQLHRQLIIASGFDRIYDIGPSWRAENSNTHRHMCEHRGCAPEMTLTDERDTMKLEEEMVAHTLKKVKKECKDDLDHLGVKVKVPETPFPVLAFPKIWDVLKKMGSETKHGEDLAREDEKLLQEHVEKKHHSDFFFVNRFPFEHKPFYVMRYDDDPEYARSVDMIYRGIELSSGGQREHRYEKIMEQVRIKKMSPESVEWFTKFFRYGAPPHGGFCIGIERLTMQMLGIHNVREATLFPRDPDRILP